MTPERVSEQLRLVMTRLISASLSYKQFVPREDRVDGRLLRIGSIAATALALKNSPYQHIYDELDQNDAYHVKLPDGGLLIFQYTFDSHGALTKHRLAYFPSPKLPTIDEYPHLYEDDELYADIILDQIVRFPIRFDYDPKNHVDVFHPMSHLTLGQFSFCRIPISSPVAPNVFVMFLLRNFYHRAYMIHKNKFEKRILNILPATTITTAERRLSHFVMM